MASVKAKRLNKYLFIYIFHKLRFYVIFLLSRPVKNTLSQFQNDFECVLSVPIRIRQRGLGAPGGIGRKINCLGETEHPSVF